MDHLKMHTPDIADENYKKLAALFPNAVTETTDENGKVVRAIDKDVLMQEINTRVVDGKEERYQFTWPDKKKSILLANAPIAKTLRFEKEKSVGRDGTGGTDSENIYIEGDNLDALKLLQETYLGKVKMIYIDPPYNTGNDFVYEDDFRTESLEFREKSGNYDEEGNQIVGRLEKNTESNGRFHTDWLNMIYPRLKLARDLLSDDGVIFISIDDNEQSNLKKICDEIFVKSNFIGTLILKTATDNNPSQINIEHEYMLCYAKSKIKQNNWVRTSESAKKIIDKYTELKSKKLSVEEIQTELRKWIKTNKAQLPQVAHYNCVDNKGVYSCSSNSSNPHPGGYMYDIIHPKTKLPCPKPQNGWRWPEKTFLNYVAQGEIEWGFDESTQPHVKKRIETAVDYLRSLIYEDNRATTKMLADLFDGHKVFDNPKPTSVLKRIIDYVTTPSSLTSTPSAPIILDFFSGSATTAHAVMQLNAEDGGHRKFIMVQLPEKCDEKSEAFKAGYKTICDIGEERIRRAGRKILADFLGSREKNIGSSIGGENGSELQESDCLAKGNECNQGDLFSSEETSKGRTLRAVGPDEAGGGVDSVEHSGGKRQKFNERVHSVSEYSERLKSGTGNSTSALQGNRLPNADGNSADNDATRRNRQDVKYNDTQTSSLIPTPSSLVPDIGFRCFKIDTSNMEDVYYSPQELQNKDLFKDNIKPDRTAEDLLVQVMLDLGILLSSKIEAKQINGKEVFCVEGNYLMTCFDKDVTEEVVTEIAKQKPYYFVMRDPSDAQDGDSLITNFEQIFATYSPDTQRKVL